MTTRYRLVTDREGFAALRRDWNALVAACPVDHAFMRHEWFECWLDAFHSTEKLAVHTAWADDRLVAAAPMRIVVQKRRGVQLRILQFLQSSISPRCNMIVHPDADAHGFFDVLFAVPGWDIMELRTVEVGQDISKSFLEYLERNNDYVVEPNFESPYEILDGTWESFYRSHSIGYQKSIRNSANRIAKAGEHKIVVLETPEDFSEYFDDLVAISSRGWKAALGTDLGSDLREAEFYRRFSSVGAAQGLCIAYVLFVDGKPIAFDYYLRHRNRLAGIRWEYDNDYKYYMPGTHLHARVIRDLLGTSEPWEYDLCGMTSEYKSDMVRSMRQHVDITVGRPGMRGKMLVLLKGALKTLRTISERDRDRAPASAVAH